MFIFQKTQSQARQPRMCRSANIKDGDGGKESFEQLSHQQHLRVSQVGQLARSNNILVREDMERRNRVVKYRKNKTENMAFKIASVRNKERRKSSQEENFFCGKSFKSSRLCLLVTIYIYNIYGKKQRVLIKDA